MIKNVLDKIKNVGLSELGVISAVIFGSLLRFYQISTQIIGEDEWHALHASLFTGFKHVLTHFSAIGLADNCIPLTILYKIMIKTTGLSELSMRFPILLFGIASLVIFPFLVRNHIGKSASVVFAWLLAISPVHIYFSRYARPYSISTFFVFVGTVAFYKWWTDKRNKMAYTYVICAVLAPYFHLTALFFILSPILYALISFTSQPNKRDKIMLVGLARIILSVFMGLAVLFFFPVLFNMNAIEGKTSMDIINFKTIIHAFQFTIGTKETWIVLVALFISLFTGSFALIKKDKYLFSYLLFLSLIQLLVVIVSRPMWCQAGIIFFRYCLPIFPVFLLMFASGICHIDGMIYHKYKQLPVNACAFAICVLLLFTGPLKETYYRPNQFTNHQLFQYDYDIDENLLKNAVAPDTISPFYSRLGLLPKESVLIVETPFYFPWRDSPYAYYQRIHKQRMSIGFMREVCGTGPQEFDRKYNGLAFKYIFHLADITTLINKNACYVVLHKNLRTEMLRNKFDIDEWIMPDYDINPLVKYYTDAFGIRFYEDDDIVVFKISKNKNSGNDIV